MPLRSITLLVVVAYLDVQTIYGAVRSPVLKDYLMMNHPRTIRSDFSQSAIVV